MTDGIDLLRELCREALESDGSRETGLQPGMLRFMLEYPDGLSLEQEKRRLAVLLQSDAFQLFRLPGDEPGPASDTDIRMPADGTDGTDVTHRTDGVSEQTMPLAERDEEFGEFLILQFPWLERTLSHRSLFDMAYALESELDLMSVEPELGTAVFVDPPAPGERLEEQIEGVIRDTFTSNCWVKEDAPHDTTWVLSSMNIPAAWSRSPDKGRHVLIAQPDTGIAEHRELDGANFRLDLAIDLIDGDISPVDPLRAGAANPGHGTGTASVIACQSDGRIRGAAPGAQVVPIRCVEDVKILETAPLTAAINHARTSGCHIITMSLGGIPSRSMKKAIRQAVDNDLLVLAAAGNCVELVVWPARYRDVIAVGGSNVHDKPWKGSSHGPDVDICAPAELVWVARRKPGDQQQDFTEGAQGTSFATALTAAAAALWLSHHGRDRLIGIARRSGIRLQELFRRALKATARIPDGWHTQDYGAGIVDADALLALSPEAIVARSLHTRSVAEHAAETASASSRHTDTDTDTDTDDTAAVVNADHSARIVDIDANRLLDSLETSSAPAESTVGLDGQRQRFAREIALNVLEAARQGGIDARGQGIESITTGIGLSATLAEHIASSGDFLLHPLGRMTQAPPAARVAQSLSPTDTSTLARVSLQPQQQLESASTRSVQATRQAINAATIKVQLDALEQTIDSSPLSSDTSATQRQRLKDEVMQDTEAVLNRLKRGDTVSKNDVRSTTALEALVKTKGRPAIRLLDGPIDINDPNLQEWVGVLAMLQDTLPAIAMSVGRIDAEGIHQGTGFLVGPGIVLTNRHVVEGFAAPLPTRLKPDRWLIERDVTIDFSPSADSLSTRFRIEDVLFTGPDPISGDPLINHDELDLALLAVESTSMSGRPLPQVLDIGNSKNKTALNRKLLLIGYPAAPANFPKDDEGRIRLDVVERIRQLFGMDYGLCYLSPGLVETPVDRFDQGIRSLSLTHDATSLGGSSGSCLLACDSSLEVVALHYGGDWLRANFAHDLAHVTNTLINLPGLIRQLSGARDMGTSAYRLAERQNLVRDDIVLSASDLTESTAGRQELPS